MILLLVIGIFFLTSFASPYGKFMRLYAIAYPDSMGFLGGFLFGLPLTWVMLPPGSGSLGNATRREKGLFIAGLVWTLILSAIIIAVFAASSDPDPTF